MPSLELADWFLDSSAMFQFELEGTIKVVLDMMTFDSGFQKREFVVTTTDDAYPQDVKFELIKDKCFLADSLQANDRVRVSFNIRGNAWQGKYFVNLQVLARCAIALLHSPSCSDRVSMCEQAWRVEKIDGSPMPGLEISPEWGQYASNQPQSAPVAPLAPPRPVQAQGQPAAAWQQAKPAQPQAQPIAAWTNAPSAPKPTGAQPSSSISWDDDMPF